MAQLLVRNLSPSLVKQLKLRAVEHGVSAEEEHRRILAAALVKRVEEKPEVVEVEKLETVEPKKKRTLIDAFRELGEIAPDFEFVRDRKLSLSREVDL